MPVPRRTFKCLRQSADAPTGMEGRLDSGATSDGLRLETEAERSRVGAERQRGQPRPRFRGAQARLPESRPMPRVKPPGTLQKPMSVDRGTQESGVRPIRRAHGRRPRPTFPNPAATFFRRLVSSAACARGGLCGGTGASRWCPRLPCFRAPPARRVRA